VFANFYLSPFDHYVKNTLKIKQYVRYVDDCVLVSKNKTYLKTLIPLFKRFLKSELRLRLNPKKLYLQNATNGVEFLGCFIKPTHTVCSGRIKNNFEAALSACSAIARDHKPSVTEKEDFRATVNSYLGILGHYRTFLFRTELLRRYISLVEQVFHSRCVLSTIYYDDHDMPLYPGGNPVVCRILEPDRGLVKVVNV
jgi:RNA-directed DNA polymerase